MSMERVREYVSQIRTLDADAMAQAKTRLDGLAKPPCSLGVLEDIAIRLAGINGTMLCDLSRRCVIIMASDNGVVAEGVASAPQSVTYAQTVNFTRGLTGVSVLAKQFHADLRIVDVGINADLNNPHVLNRKIRKSTWNIAHRAAMTYSEAVQALVVGIETALEAVNDGYALLGAGEMGIGNTTTSAAVLCALTGIPAEQATGKGAGLTEEAYRHKIEIIRTALHTTSPDPRDPIDVLAKVGGFDIAALTGVFIGAAYARTPVVIDGMISMVAALAASRLNPLIREFLFASHASSEQGFAHAALALGMEAPLRLHMRLGEGSGCPIMFAVMDAACAVIRDMGSFEQANIDEEYVHAIRDGGTFSVSNT